MALFQYEAADKQGKVISGKRDADSAKEIVDFLHEKDLIVITIEESFDFKNILSLQIGGVPYKERVFLIKQLTFMMEAGLPILQSLEVLVDQAKYPGLKEKLKKAHNDVKGGLPLATSFAKQDVLFDEIQISLIQSAEKSGNLVEVMQQISIDIEKKQKLKNKVKNALIYPTIIVLTAIVVMVILVIYMVPAVVDLYSDLGAEDQIPLITRILVGISNFFTSPGGLIVTALIVLGLVLGYRVAYASQGGKSVIDKAYLKMPILGKLLNNVQVVEMTRMLAMLLKSGIPIIDAMYSTAGGLSNYHYSTALITSAEKVSKGSSIALSLARSEVIPNIVIKMIATGEDTGSLDKILKDLSEFYENEVNEMTANLTSLIEPVLLLVVGIMVAFLAIAVYFPIYNIAQII
ncbi:type II secretion system F family protein [Candidatus Dojkabacteria bacterium]|uniref:Type II secretion system F family protein n=1 Tax=Candidatus Dojkabacteria bacterium TaxID=2099670 RepID=A0A955I888_9BACT|nr:type II secretion system F family protein [Candidatus Dojkabacteria bacterium]